MFEKRNLNKQIKKSRYKIELLEQKRARSQAALVSAILTHTTPDDEDVDIFNEITAQIDAEREVLRALLAQQK